MYHQKSNDASYGILYLVPTPIGNFLDMTYRAVETLQQSDFIFCEDTRVTGLLLSHFNITTKLHSYHNFNEEEATNKILQLLLEGKKVSLVSDAGMPLVSDPGFLIVKQAIKNSIPVISLPGASASLTALISSGLPNDRFIFIGFLPHTKSQKQKELETLKNITSTLIFYESPLRVKETLEVMLNVLGNRNISIGRELTKKYEEYYRGTINDVINYDITYKGEFVLVVEGTKETSLQLELNSLRIKEHFTYYQNLGFTDNESKKKVAKDRGISKSEVYKQLL